MVKCDSIHKEDFIDSLKHWRLCIYDFSRRDFEISRFDAGKVAVLDQLIKEIEEGKHDYKFKVFNR